MKNIDKSILREVLTRNHIAYTRYFFKHRESLKFIINKHHLIIAKTLDKVFSGEIKRLIINIPPGYTKTEMAVIDFVGRGLALNPAAKFIHTSYSSDLAMTNSSRIKEMVLSDVYQELWPLTLKKDSKAKKAWYTEEGGGMLAVSSGGAITGYRAGRMFEGFSGAIISDDPLKPEDAYSDAKRTQVNNRINNTLKSRLAHDNIPMIFIMQRLHEDDPTGFLLRGGTGEKWHHLILPSEIKEDYVYPKEYKYGIEIKHNLAEGALWEYKHTLEMLKVMRDSDPYTTAAQYDQKPTPLGGGIFKDSWWKYYNTEVLPQFKYRFITADTAQKDKEANDYSVFGCFGVCDDKVYLLDIIRGKWESPELKIVFKDFWDKHKNLTATSGRMRALYVEDKVSGTDLIQNLQKEMPIIAVQRNKSKVTRAMDTVPYVTTGRVLLPESAIWLSDFKDEIRKFTPLMTHKHDDQVDMFMDGVEIGLMDNKNEAGAW